MSFVAPVASVIVRYPLFCYSLSSLLCLSRQDFSRRLSENELLCPVYRFKEIHRFRLPLEWHANRQFLWEWVAKKCGRRSGESHTAQSHTTGYRAGSWNCCCYFECKLFTSRASRAKTCWGEVTRMVNSLPREKGCHSSSTLETLCTFELPSSSSSSLASVASLTQHFTVRRNQSRVRQLLLKNEGE